jgi:hypothetical protein
MLTVAQPYFQRHDFRGDVILHAAFPHPLLKCQGLGGPVVVSCGDLPRTVDLKRSQARSYFAPLSRSAITRS